MFNFTAVRQILPPVCNSSSQKVYQPNDINPSKNFFQSNIQHKRIQNCYKQILKQRLINNYTHHYDILRLKGCTDTINLNTPQIRFSSVCTSQLSFLVLFRNKLQWGKRLLLRQHQRQSVIVRFNINLFLRFNSKV